MTVGTTPDEDQSDDQNRGDPGHSEDRSLRRAFMDGLKRPSITGTLGAFIVAACQLLVACVVVTPLNLARIPSGYALDNELDVFTQATFDIHKMRASDPRDTGVLLVGSSTLREAVFDDNAIQDALSNSMNADVSFYRITSGWQSLWETVAIVDYLPNGFRGVIIVGVDPGRMGLARDALARRIKTPLLAIDSPNYRDEIHTAGLKPPRRTGIFLLDHARFISARKTIPLRLIGGPIEPEMHFSHLSESWSDDKWEQVERVDLPQWIQEYESHGALNLQLLDRLHKRIRQAGSRLVLLETPLHPRVRRACGAKYQNYCEWVQRFAEQQDVPYWSLDQEAQLEAEDFSDFIHLRTHTSQLRYQTVIMNKIEPVLRHIRGNQ